MKKGRAAAGAAVAIFGLVLIPAGPASAANPSTTITSPGNGQALGNATVPIGGSTSITPGLLGNNAITGVSVSVTGASTASCSNNGCGATLGRSSTTFSYSPFLAYNGPYSATANVTANEYASLDNPLGPAPRSDSASVSFKVAVSPAAPHGVAASANADRSVTVSWARNTEPDIIGYQVQRQAPGGSQLTPASGLIAPGGSTLTWVDQVPAQAGGTFGYAVFAARPNGDGSRTSPMTAVSGIATVNVPAPPPPPTSPPPTDGSTTLPLVIPATTGTTVAPAGAPTLDLSHFLSNSAGSKLAIPATGSKVGIPSGSSRLAIPSSQGPPDTGFAMTLPFGQAPKLATPNGGAGQVALDAPPVTKTHQRSLLLPLAAGLFLAVAGVHLRFFNRHFGAGALEPLAPLSDGADPEGGIVPATGTAGPVGQRISALAHTVRTTTVPWGVARVSALARSVSAKAAPSRVRQAVGAKSVRNHLSSLRTAWDRSRSRLRRPRR